MSLECIRSVNVGQPRKIQVRGQELVTGIFKEPLSGPCAVGLWGLQGDVRVDRRKLGEAHHAVYAFPYEHYAYWAGELGRSDFTLGQFGENLTVEGLLEDDVRIGDILRCGSVLLQVSQPRIPCRKLDARMGEPFSSRFLRSSKVGFYLRVLEPGQVCAGDTVRLVERDERSVTVAEFVRITQFDYWHAGDLRHVLAARDLAQGWREIVQAKLERAEEAAGWAGTRQLQVVARRPLGGHMADVELRCARADALPAFEPGRMLVFSLRRDEGSRADRVVVPLLPAVEEGSYRVLVWQPPSGSESAAGLLFERAQVGNELRAEAPRGGVSCADLEVGTRVLALAQGLGVAALSAVLQARVPQAQLSTEEAPQLRYELDSRYDSALLAPLVSGVRCGELPGVAEPQGERGAMHLVSGAAGFVARCTAALQSQGVERGQIRSLVIG